MDEPPLKYNKELKCWFLVKEGILITNENNEPVAIAWRKDVNAILRPEGEKDEN